MGNPAHLHEGNPPMSTDLHISPEQEYFTDAQLAALESMGTRGSRAEMQIFFHQVKRTGLDPFARQIYGLPRKGRLSIQTSIDGFRLVADRACQQRGWTRSEEDTVWYDKTGKEHTVWLAQEPPAAARYTAVVGTTNGPGRFSAVARFDEYRAGGPMWDKMSALMIAKCAEALALRKAFPQDLSGLYTDDEMAQAAGQSSNRQAAPAPQDPWSAKAEQVPARDWTAEADALTDREALLALYREALAAAAGKAVLDHIVARGKDVASAAAPAEPETVEAEVVADDDDTAGDPFASAADDDVWAV